MSRAKGHDNDDNNNNDDVGAEYDGKTVILTTDATIMTTKRYFETERRLRR